MTIFLIKSLLALFLLVLAGHGMYTMLEVFGKNASAERAAQLKKRHKVSGWTFVILFSLVSYLCIVFLAVSRAEPSPRASLHILFAFVIIALFIVKVLFVRVYRQFYGVARTIGIAPRGCRSWKRMLSAVAGCPLFGSRGFLSKPLRPGPTFVCVLSGS